MPSTVLIGLLMMLLLGTLPHLATQQTLELLPEPPASNDGENPVDRGADAMPQITYTEKEV